MSASTSHDLARLTKQEPIVQIKTAIMLAANRGGYSTEYKTTHPDAPKYVEQLESEGYSCKLHDEGSYYILLIGW